MYGKKRIVITKDNKIVYCGRGENGGGSWITIGVVTENEHGVIAKYLPPKDMFKGVLKDGEYAILGVKNKNEVRKVIKNLYNL